MCGLSPFVFFCTLWGWTGGGGSVGRQSDSECSGTTATMITETQFLTALASVSRAFRAQHLFREAQCSEAQESEQKVVKSFESKYYRIIAYPAQGANADLDSSATRFLPSVDILQVIGVEAHENRRASMTERQAKPPYSPIKKFSSVLLQQTTCVVSFFSKKRIPRFRAIKLA